MLLRMQTSHIKCKISNKFLNVCEREEVVKRNKDGHLPSPSSVSVKKSSIEKNPFSRHLTNIKINGLISELQLLWLFPIKASFNGRAINQFPPYIPFGSGTSRNGLRYGYSVILKIGVQFESNIIILDLFFAKQYNKVKVYCLAACKASICSPFCFQFT